MALDDLAQHHSTGGDTADAAFDAASEALASSLAELEARELLQVERALAKLKNGTYGRCEGCGCKIPIASMPCLIAHTASSANGNWKKKERMPGHNVMIGPASATQTTVERRFT
jgi:RNA polymerase-binding transcription factor DksA